MATVKGHSTRSVHLGNHVDSTHRSIVPPIVENAAFAFSDLETWQETVSGRVKGNTYGRNTNPTRRQFEEKIAALEGAEDGSAFSTGMAAISTTLFALLDSSKRAVATEETYGATYRLFTEVLPKFGVECCVCRTEDYDGIEAAIEQGCDLFFTETPTNPMLKVVDLPRLIEAAHRKGAVTVVDNTFGTPINQRPMELGSDLIVHSATKYICGHSDALGGIVCGKQELIDEINGLRELTGAILDPHSAFLLHRGVRTLGLRVQRQNENALALARYLEQRPEVESVYYPGLKSNKGYNIAKRQMSGFGGVLSFTLQGGLASVDPFLRKLRLAYLAPNLGQVETIVGTAITTSHAECTDEELKTLGIPKGLIRYAAGIEDVDDLIADVGQALDALQTVDSVRSYKSLAQYA